MALRIQLRRDSASNWAANNPILLSGELGVETDTLKFKIGNGGRWNTITSYAFKLGEANGVAQLGPTGKILTSQLPDTISVNAEVAQAIAAITTSSVAEGTNQYFTNARAVSALANTVSSALSTASADATSKANSAQSAAISAASTDATTKASAAQSAAISAASTDATTKANAARTAAENASATYTDAKIATEVTNRNSAITTAVAGVSGGSTILSSKTTDDLAEGINNLYYTDEKAIAAVNPSITNVLIALNGNIDDLSSSIDSTYVKKSTADSRYVLQSGLQNSLDQYVLESGRDVAFGYAGIDSSGKILSSVIPTTIARSSDVTSSISTAIAGEVTNRNSAITGAINNLITSAPGTLDTLGEIATALQADQSAVSAITTAIALKAPLASPTFTGTVSGITKSMVGLSNVDNTTDANKPISNATQTALNLKAPLISPTFTGAVDFSGATVTGLDSTLPDQMGYSGKYLKTDGTNASWENIDLTLYLTTQTAAATYATLDNAKTYGYHNAGSNTAGNKIAYGTSATPSIGSPVAGDIYIQY